LKKKEDVAGAKMLKAFHFIEGKLLANDFEIIESDMLWHEGREPLFYYVIKESKLSKNIEVLGPPKKISKHVAAFKKKHKKTFIKGNRLFAIEKRKFTNAKNLVKYLIKTSNVKDNVSSIKII
ncbi:hypothetical protein IH824_04700, partial [candidate division KSB1 bacterium]|nr:hypothetical protein [candidate division KSB1 bacterium]